MKAKFESVKLNDLKTNWHYANELDISVEIWSYDHFFFLYPSNL